MATQVFNAEYLLMNAIRSVGEISVMCGVTAACIIFEEDFESYEQEIFAASTKMTDFFTCDANSIGDGYIKVKKDGEENRYLHSYVFTEVHNTTPIVGAYEFSLDVLDAKGSYSSGVFVRGVKMKAAFYESDGHPHASMSQTGLLIYPRPDELRVNVKTYDESWDENAAYLQNNVQSFALPNGVTYPYNLRVSDSGSDISIFVNDTLVCRIALSSPGKTYEKHESEVGYFGSATVYDDKGGELASYADTLLCSDNALFGWATRSSEMRVDHVRVKVGSVQKTILEIEKIPAQIHAGNVQTAKELVATALYDSWRR